MKKKKLIINIVVVIIAILFCTFLYFNTGLKGFEREVSNVKLPESIKKIEMKSGIGDSGGNGNQSTYRVVLVITTEMTISELNDELESQDFAFNYYVTKCKDKVFKSPRKFQLTFDKLNGVNDFSYYYFIEFII